MMMLYSSAHNRILRDQGAMLTIKPICSAHNTARGTAAVPEAERQTGGRRSRQRGVGMFQVANNYKFIVSTLSP